MAISVFTYNGASNVKTFNIKANKLVISEDSDIVSFSIDTYNVANDTILYWRVVSVTGSLTASDFTAGTSGQITVTNNAASFDLITNPDLLIETESFRVELHRTSAYSKKVAESEVITILDTSVYVEPPAMTVQSNNTTVSNNSVIDTNTVTLSGTGTQNDTISIFKDNTYVASVVIPASGEWTYQSQLLLNGEHSFTTTTTDAATGATSDFSPPKTFTVQGTVASDLLLLIDDTSGQDLSLYKTLRSDLGVVEVVNDSAISNHALFDFNGNTCYTFRNEVYARYTADFTVDFWMNRVGSMGISGIFATGGVYSSHNGILIHANNTSLSVGIGRGGAHEMINIPIDYNEWTHIALVRSENIIYAFKNGSLVASKLTNISLTNDILSVGRRYDNCGSTWMLRNAYVSAIRFLGYAEWTSDFTPINDYYNPFALAPSYIVAGNKTSLNENSSVTFTLTTLNVDNGTPLYWRIEGTSNEMSSSDFVNNLSGSVTINNNTGTVVLTTRPDLTTEGIETFKLKFYTNSNFANFAVESQEISIIDSSIYVAPPEFLVKVSNESVSSGSTIAAKSVTISGTGTNKNIIKIYQNNQLVKTLTIANGIWETTITGLSEGFYVFEATCTDVITNNTSQFSSEFFVTVDLPAAGLILLVNDGTTKDRSSYNNSCSTLGSYSTVPQPKKFIYPSYSFKNSALTYSNANFAFGTGDFTVDFWVYRTGLMGTAGIVSSSSTYNGAQGFATFTDNTGISLGIGNGSSNIVTKVTIPLNEWTHLALVRNSGTIYVFANGSLVSAKAGTRNLTSSAITIGRRYVNATTWTLQNALISNVRVLGYADNISLQTNDYYQTVTPSYNLTENKTSLNESDSIYFTVTGSNSISGTQLYWEAQGVNGTINSSDFSSDISGFVSMERDLGTFSMTTKPDFTTEGTESFKIKLYDNASYNMLIDESQIIYISDSSLTPVLTSVSANKLVVTETDIITFSLSTVNIPNNSKIYYDIIAKSGTIISTDFISSISGPINIFSNSGSLVLSTNPDSLTEGVESFSVKFYLDSNHTWLLGESESISIQDTSLSPTYSISSAKTAINENDSITFVMNTTYVTNNTLFSWEIADVTSNSSDFVTTSGTFNVFNNYGSFTVTSINDKTTEGAEAFKVRVKDSNNNIVTESSSITINDTSKTPIYNFSFNKTTLNEDETLYVIVNTQNVPNNTTLYWRVSGTNVNANDFISNNSGLCNVLNNATSFNIILKPDISFAEGTETFNIILSETLNGSQVAQSSAITVLDSSYQTYSISADKTSVNEGEQLSLSVTTYNVPNGTTLYWRAVEISGTIRTADFNPAYEGSLVVNNNSGSAVVSITSDWLTEGNETFRIDLRLGSTTGTTVAQTSQITIIDSSRTPSVVITSDKSSFTENESVIFNVQPINIPNGTDLYWSVIGVTGKIRSSDFITQMSGTVTVLNDTASVGIIANPDFEYEGTETFKLRIQLGSSSGIQLGESSAVSMLETSVITYNITPDSTSINEGQTVRCVLTTTNVANNTTLHWQIVAMEGGVYAEDFTTPYSEGTVTVGNNSGVFYITAKADQLTEGNETFMIQLREGSRFGNLLYTYESITIVDTSLTRTYTVGVNKTTLNEDNDQFTCTVTTANVPNGTTLYWAVVDPHGTVKSTDFFSAASGTLTISDNSGSFSLTTKPDAVTEEVEDFVIDIRTGSAGGTIVASSANISILDTSRVSYTIYQNPNQLTYKESDYMYFIVGTTNVPNGTTLYWSIEGDLTSDDFEGGKNYGTVQINSNGGVFNTGRLKEDQITEGNETFFVRLRKGGYAGEIVGTSATYSVQDTSQTQIFGVTVDKSSVIEGESFTATINSSGVPNNTTVYWQMVPVTGVVGASDLNYISGTTSIVNNTATIALTAAVDANIESNELFLIRLRRTNASGAILADSPTVTIVDNTVVTDLSVSPNKAFMSEYDNITFTVNIVNTTAYPNGTTLYWDVTSVQGTIANNDFQGSTTGSTQVTNGTATVTLNTVNENIVEGSELFKMRIFTDSGRANLVAESESVTIVDSPVFNLTFDKTTVSEGDTIECTLNTTLIEDGTTVYWYIVTSPTSAADFEATNGTVNVYDSTASFFVKTTSDGILEGSETFNICLALGSLNGIVRYQSPTLTIADTSYPTYTIASDRTAMDENDTLAVNVSTTHIADNTTLYWQVIGVSGTINSSDFTGGTNGSVVINSNSGSFTLTTSADFTTEGNESFKVRLYTGSVGGTQVAETSVITIADTSYPTYAIAAERTTMDENDTITCFVNTTDVANSTVLYWQVIGVTGTINSSDFTTAISGSVTINTNTASFILSTAADVATEGTETFKVRLYTGSVGGTQVAETSVITIADTSLAPTYAISTDKASINENETITANITTARVANGTTLYWEVIGVSGTVNSSDFTSAITGTVNIANNAASFSLTTTADAITEGSESFKIRVYTGSLAGTQVAETSVINIADTSMGSSSIPSIASVSERTVLSVTSDISANAANNTVVDSSTNNLTVTRNGNVTQGTVSPFYSNWSNYFDGSSYLTFPSSTAYDFGTGDFTIETWIFPTDMSVDQHILSNNWLNNNNLILALMSTGAINYWLGHASLGYINVTTSTNAIQINAWSHIALVRSSGVVKCYINGVQIASNACTANMMGSNGSFVVGQYYNPGQGNGFRGYISNVNILKAVAKYTSAFTTPTSNITSTANTSLLTCQSNYFKDNSSNNFSVTVTGTPRVSHLSPFVNSSYSAGTNSGSLYFDGSGDYLSVAHSSAFDFSTVDFTIEFWMYRLTAVGVKEVLGRTVGYTGIHLQMDTSTTINLYSTDISGSWNIANGISIGDVIANQWSHISIVRSGNTLYGFVNGKLGTTVNVTGKSLNMGSTNPPWLIGSGHNSTTVNAYISNVHFVKGTALYSTNFTPSTTPLSAITNTQLLLSGTNGHILDYVSNSNVETVGDVKTNNTVYRSKSSMYFDGAGDYLTITDNQAINVGSNDFTIESWCYQTNRTAGEYDSLFRLDNNGSGFNAGMYLTIGAAGFILLVANTAKNGWAVNISMNSYLPPLGTWYHIAVVRSSSIWTVYLNGVSIGTATYAGAVNTSVGGMNIGYSGTADSYFEGYLEDFKFHRYAKYISNFSLIGSPQARTLLVNGDTTSLGQNNTILDSSANNIALSRAGNVTQGTVSPFYTNWSNYFNGTTSWMSATNPNMSGSWTVECWFNCTKSATQQTILSFNNGGWQGINIWINTSNKLVVDDGANAQTAFTTTIPMNAWNHVAIVRNVTTTSAYLNGVLIGSNSFVPYTTNAISIGRYNNSPNFYFNGYISNLRVVTGTAVYTSNFTPSAIPLTAISGTQLLTCQSSSFIDNSSNKVTITATGTPTISKISPFNSSYLPAVNGGSLYFDGTGDYLTTPSGLSISNDFTVECWVYENTTPTNSNYIGQNLNSSNALNIGTINGYVFVSFGTMISGSAGESSNITLTPPAGTTIVRGVQNWYGYGGSYIANYQPAYNGVLGATSAVGFNVSNSAFGGDPISGTVKSGSMKVLCGYKSVKKVLANEWTHIAVSRSGSTLKIFINGVLDATHTTSTAIGNATFYIGNSFHSNTYSAGIYGHYFNGYISNMRVMSTANYTANFTPSTTPLTAITNTQLLLSGTNGHIIDSTLNNVIETVGDAKVDLTTKKYISSIKFDGTGDYLLIPSSSLLSVGTGDFTFECWINNVGAWSSTFDITDGSPGAFCIYVGGSTIRICPQNASSISLGSVSTLTSNTWYHIAVVRSSGTTKSYINGTLLTSVADTNNYGAFTKIGGTADGYFNGYIEDLSFSKYAKYSSSFTPPTKYS